MEKNSKQNIGNAGEYYIASRLSAENFIATITLGRAEKYDILAVSPSRSNIKLSVKTTQLKDAKDFPLSDKDEGGEDNDFYYAFVKLNNFEKEPDFWIIPSKVVCPLLRTSEEIWLKTPGRNNRQHNSSTLRILPVEVRESSLKLYPKNWSNDVRQYYKNINQLK